MGRSLPHKQLAWELSGIENSKYKIPCNAKNAGVFEFGYSYNDIM